MTKLVSHLMEVICIVIVKNGSDVCEGCRTTGFEMMPILSEEIKSQYEVHRIWIYR